MAWKLENFVEVVKHLLSVLKVLVIDRLFVEIPEIVEPVDRELSQIVAIANLVFTDGEIDQIGEALKFH